MNARARTRDAAKADFGVDASPINVTAPLWQAGIACAILSVFFLVIAFVLYRQEKLEMTSHTRRLQEVEAERAGASRIAAVARTKKIEAEQEEREAIRSKLAELEAQRRSLEQKRGAIARENRNLVRTFQEKRLKD